MKYNALSINRAFCGGIVLLIIFFLRPSSAQQNYIPLPAGAVTEECDGLIAGCWVTDIAETGDVPIQCVQEYLELSKIRIRACALDEDSLSSYVDYELRLIDEYLKDKPVGAVNEKALSKYESYLSERAASGHDFCKSEKYVEIFDKLRRIKNNDEVQYFLKNKNNKISCRKT